VQPTAPGRGGGQLNPSHFVAFWQETSQRGIGPPCSKQPGRPGLTPPVSSTPSLRAFPSGTAPPPRARGRRHNPADTLRPSSSLFLQYMTQIAVGVSDSYSFLSCNPRRWHPFRGLRGQRTNTHTPPPTIPSPCRPPLRPPLLSLPVGGDPGLLLRRGGVAPQHPGQTPSMEWGPRPRRIFCDRLVLNPLGSPRGVLAAALAVLAGGLIAVVVPSPRPFLAMPRGPPESTRRPPFSSVAVPPSLAISSLVATLPSSSDRSAGSFQRPPGTSPRGRRDSTAALPRTCPLPTPSPRPVADDAFHLARFSGPNTHESVARHKSDREQRPVFYL